MRSPIQPLTPLLKWCFGPIGLLEKSRCIFCKEKRHDFLITQLSSYLSFFLAFFYYLSIYQVLIHKIFRRKTKKHHRSQKFLCTSALISLLRDHQYENSQSQISIFALNDLKSISRYEKSRQRKQWVTKILIHCKLFPLPSDSTTGICGKHQEQFH